MVNFLSLAWVFAALHVGVLIAIRISRKSLPSTWRLTEQNKNKITHTEDGWVSGRRRLRKASVCVCFDIHLIMFSMIIGSMMSAFELKPLISSTATNRLTWWCVCVFRTKNAELELHMTAPAVFRFDSEDRKIRSESFFDENSTMAPPF